jgi:RHS repeat-associated protein
VEDPVERLHSFTGHESEDNDSYVFRTTYMHARYYNASAGRFYSVDPVSGTPAQPQSWNRYSYVSNNPINATDPDGRMILCTPGCSNALKKLGAATAHAFSSAMDRAAPVIAAGALVFDIVKMADGLQPPSFEAIQNDIEDVESELPSLEQAPARSTDFVITPEGEAIPVPNGANGPNAPERGTGMSYQGGSGGKGMDTRTTGVRVMDANSNQGQRVNYMNTSGQTVDPRTGRTIPKADPAGHIPLKPFDPTPPPPPPPPRDVP